MSASELAQLGGGARQPPRSRPLTPHPSIRLYRSMLESLFDTPPRDPAEILRTVFGHQSFRGQQEDVVRHVAAGGDAVVLFPTGAGKSMCFQVPALARQGVGIVV